MSVLISTAELEAELNEIAGESIGWQSLGDRAYVHQADVGSEDEDQTITVIGIADAGMAAMNLLLVG